MQNRAVDVGADGAVNYRERLSPSLWSLVAAALAGPALVLEIFFVAHYFVTGSFSPHLWAGFTGAGLGSLALALHRGSIATVEMEKPSEGR